MSKSKNRLWYWPALVLLCVGTIFIIRKNTADTVYHTYTGNVFGTVYKITYQGNAILIDSCQQTLAAVDDALSMFNPSGNLSRINRGETDEMSAMTKEVLTLALAVSKATDGCFDVSVAPLVNAWGFGYKTGSLPDSATVDSLKSLVGYEKIVINGNRISKPKDMTLDCSAIAKGYGCDAVAQTLKRNGVCNMLIEIGGEIVTHGVNAQGKAWSVGVSRPSEDVEQQDVTHIISLTDGAMATSGNYRNFRIEADGRKIAHTIDPKTGFPVQHSLLSATVTAPSCAMADAYATAFMVMGRERAAAILSADARLGGYLIYDEAGEMIGWEKK